MEDFPILLISLIVYLITASSGNKKKKHKTRRSDGPIRTAAQGEQHDRVSAARSVQTHRGFAEAFEPEQAAQQEASRHSSIHLHEVSQEQMTRAAEGEDPCHAGDASSAEDAAYVRAEGEDSLAQDLLRGVIMSEILARPQERAALRAEWRRNRQGYHG